MIKDLLSCFSFNFYIINNTGLLGCVNLFEKLFAHFPRQIENDAGFTNYIGFPRKKIPKLFFFKGKYFITHLQIFIYKYVHPIQQRVIITLIICNDFPGRTEIIKLILNVGPFYRHIFITNMKVN